MTELVDGQVYRWSYREAPKHGDHAYWCKSQIAVVKNGLLIDTYWHDMTSDRAVNPDQVDLTLVADVTWPRIRDGEQCLYAVSDVVDTRHPNSSSAPIYLRPGATRSVDAIMAELHRRREVAEGKIRSAAWDMERIGKMAQLVAEGRLEEFY